MSKNVAIIPARGGSKRIPRKNIRNFLGKPIIQYSIEAALKCPHIDEVVVSTDDEEIAEIAIKCGAQVPYMRSSKNSNDHAMLFDVVNEVLENFKQNGKFFKHFCLILATAPFVTSGTLKNSFQELENSNSDAVIPVVRFGFPIQRAFRIHDSKLNMFWPENMHVRSQDLESAYHDIGQFYWLNTQVFLNEKKIFLNNSAPYIVEEKFCQDIDTEEDWQIAEMKYRMLMSTEAT